MTLDITKDLVTITRQLVDIESVSGNEKLIADLVEENLRQLPWLEVIRDGDTVIARTNFKKDKRVLLAGHLDTVPVANNLPSKLIQVEGETRIYGRGACDMKGGVAVLLKLAAELKSARHDLTWIFYDHEEVEREKNSLTSIARQNPQYLAADFAILGEPSRAKIEAGCKGTMRLEVISRGLAAHSGRAWAGKNAIHGLAGALQALANYQAKEVEIDGLVYREALNAVGISGGIAANVIPDLATLTLNYRYAPSIDHHEALKHVQEVLKGLELEISVTDYADGALPGLDYPIVKEFIDSFEAAQIFAKQGWTDVARFSELKVPAVNFGPGDPLLAHTDNEYIPAQDLTTCFEALVKFLN